MTPTGRTQRALSSFLRQPRGSWLVLGVAMALSAGLIAFAAHGQGFAIDELFYYGRVAEKQGSLVQYSPFSPEYLLSPFNGHLPLGGRLVYEVVFATAGARYWVFVAINVAALFACVALTFELARRRVGAVAALAPCLVLLFLGFAREQLLWPLDFNTGLSLAAGLGAVLAIQRGDRRGDFLACALLGLSIAMIELGLSFALGIAVWLALERRESLRRAWIVVVPLVLYAAWWVWARKFDQSQASASHIGLIPETLFNAAAAVLGSLTGTNPVLPGSYATEVTWFGRVLAAAAAMALAVRLWWGSLPRTIWVWLAVLGSYWVQLGVAARPPQASRYILVGAILVVLIAADSMKGRVSNRLAAALLVLPLVAIPANVAQLLEGREADVLHHDPKVSGTEFAMLELAGKRVDPNYVVSADPRVTEVGGGLYIGLPASAYLDAAAHNGSIAYSPRELLEQPEELRRIADATLVGALRIRTEYAPPHETRRDCRAIEVGPGADAGFEAAAGRTVVLRAKGRRWAQIWLARLADENRGVTLGRLPPRRWIRVRLPADHAPLRWRLTLDAPLTACLGG